MLRHLPTANGATAKDTPYRVALFSINGITFHTPADAVLWGVLNLCVVPAEQRAHAHFGRDDNGDIPAALEKIEVTFPSNYILSGNPASSILDPLTTDYPTMVRSLRGLKMAHISHDESAALGTFAALTTHLQELTFYNCGLTSVRGLRGHCEYLRKVSLFGCKQLSNIDALAERVCLEEVDAACTALTSIEPLRSCPHLTTLGLFRCAELTSIEALAGHQRLREVDASCCLITSVTLLRSCPSLTKVVLRYCDQLPADVGLPASVTVIR